MSEPPAKRGAISLTAAAGGWVARWAVETFRADRELDFSDGIALAASCGVRCPRCARFIMWTYPHPTAGDVLIRRLPVDSDDQGDAIAFLVQTAQQGSVGNVKADVDSLLSRLDGRDGNDDARAWCVECREWRTVSLAALRTAIANGKSTIRATSATFR